jgi:hypothetical protein
MSFSRRAAVMLLLSISCGTLGACGGASSRLVTVRAGTGDGDIEFEVKNSTDVPINSLFIAKTEAVKASGQQVAREVWGADLLSNAALSVGQRTHIPVPAPGQWDVRAEDRDGRYQHIAAVKLQAGGRYILELYDGSWRVIQ